MRAPTGDAAPPAGTSLWLLAGLAGCAVCEEPFVVHLAGRDRRFYLCRRCQHLHPADPIERGVITAVMERDWMLAQRGDAHASFVRRWSDVPPAQVRRNLRRLLAAAVVAPASDHAVLYWTPEATIEAHSPARPALIRPSRA